MNGFINKYRWIIAIVAVGLAIALSYYSRQEEEPIIVTPDVPAPVETAVEPEVTVIEVTPEEEAVEPEADDTEDVIETPEADTEEASVIEPEGDVSETEESPADAIVESEAVEAEPEADVADEPVEQEPIEESLVEEVLEPEAVATEDLAANESATEEVVAEAAEVAEEVIDETMTEEAALVETVEEATTEAADAGQSVGEVAEETEPAEPEPAMADAEEEALPDETDQAAETAAAVEEVTSVITARSADITATDGIKPSFDVVRVDATGSAVIAGSAEPFSKVIILSNGVEIGEAIAGASGEFVAIIQVPDSDQGQTLELESEISGQLLFSDETILILPVLSSDAADSITEESAPPVIHATKDEVKIVQGAPQLALGQVSLDAISYDENDEVVLTGRGSPGRTIIIYVDDAPLMDAVVSESGSWKQALHGLDAGRYVLRVDEIDDDGNVTSRVESPFQREYPEDVREAKAANELTYTVQPGNSLWIIATGRYGDGMQYHQIFSANKDQIRNPDLIYPGQVFALPESE